MSRANMRVRRFAWDDPEQEYEPAIEAMSPSRRMELVLEASCRLLAMKGMSFDECRLPRHAVRIERRRG